MYVYIYIYVYVYVYVYVYIKKLLITISELLHCLLKYLKGIFHPKNVNDVIVTVVVTPPHFVPNLYEFILLSIKYIFKECW